jgi:hypothetical protein
LGRKDFSGAGIIPGWGERVFFAGESDDRRKENDGKDEDPLGG